MKSIIFSKEMITAILEGRKSQTRRLIKEPRLNNFTDWDETRQGYSFYTPPKKYSIRGYYKGEYGEVFLSPKYFEDEIIYVKEPFFFDTDDNSLYLKYENSGIGWSDCPWKSPLFMPEKYSRIKLKITGLKVQKLQDISEEDCFKEGIKRYIRQPYIINDVDVCGHLPEVYFENYINACEYCITAKDSYKTLINSIYKKDIWSENPFVFVYDFEILEVKECILPV